MASPFIRPVSSGHVVGIRALVLALVRAVVLAGCLLVAGCGSARLPVVPPPGPAQHVRAELTRSGGVTGLRRCAAADTDDLPEAQARRLRDLVARVDLGRVAGAHGNPRLPTLDVVVVTGPRRVQGSMDDLGVPPSLRPVVEFLDERAGPCR